MVHAVCARPRQYKGFKICSRQLGSKLLQESPVLKLGTIAKQEHAMPGAAAQGGAGVLRCCAGTGAEVEAARCCSHGRLVENH